MSIYSLGGHLSFEHSEFGTFGETFLHSYIGKGPLQSSAHPS